MPLPYTLTNQIGFGAFAPVHRAYAAGDPSDEVAVKVLSVRGEASRERLQREADVLRDVPPHPNITSYRAHYWVRGESGAAAGGGGGEAVVDFASTTDDDKLHLVMELATEGHLRRALALFRGAAPEERLDAVRAYA